MAVPTVAAFPWLIPQRMPGEALAQGVQAGAAIAAARLRSAELRAERDRVVLAQAKMMADQANDLAAREGFAALGAVTAQIARSGGWTDPKAKADFYEVAARYPMVLQDPAFKALEDNFDNAEQMKARSEYQTNLLESRQDIAQLRVDAALQGIEQRIQGAEKLEGMRQEHRKELAELKQTVDDLRSNRFDLAHSDQLLMANELAELQASPEFGIDAKVSAARRKAIEEKYKARGRFKAEAPATTPSPAGRIRVRTPDGKTGSIPASQLEEALKAGYSRID